MAAADTRSNLERPHVAHVLRGRKVKGYASVASVAVDFCCSQVRSAFTSMHMTFAEIMMTTHIQFSSQTSTSWCVRLVSLGSKSGSVCVRVYVCVCVLKLVLESAGDGKVRHCLSLTPTPNTIKLNNQKQPAYWPLPHPYTWQNFLGGLFGDISSGGEGWTALRYDVSTTPHSLRPLQNSPSPPSLGLLLVVTNFELTQGSALLFDHTGRQP